MNKAWGRAMIKYLVKESLASMDTPPPPGTKKQWVLDLLHTGLTQREIAEAVGCHEQYVQHLKSQHKIEQGESRKKTFTMINGGLK